MKLLELVTHLREYILHDTGGTGVDWSSLSKDDYNSTQLRWTNEELVGYINEAISQVYRRINPIKDLYQLPVYANEPSYNLPSYISEVLKVKKSDGNPLQEKSMDLLWDYKGFNTVTNSPLYYIPDYEQGTLRLYPTPNADDTLDMMIYRYPKVKLDWYYPDTSPELREAYQVPMLFGAAALAYLKDESNVYDPNRSNELQLRFDREFPFTSAYSNVRKERTANRSIAYGGIGSSRLVPNSRTTVRVFK